MDTFRNKACVCGCVTFKGDTNANLVTLYECTQCQRRWHEKDIPMKNTNMPAPCTKCSRDAIITIGKRTFCAVCECKQEMEATPKNPICPQCDKDDTSQWPYYKRCHNCGHMWDHKKETRTEGESIASAGVKMTEATLKAMGVSSTGAMRETLYPKGPDFPMRFDLIFTNTEALQRIARTYGEGNQKYGPTNWKKGFPESMLIAHAIDHLQKWMNGAMEDDLAHLVWNIMTLMWVQDNKPELLDLTGHLNPPSLKGSQQIEIDE